MLLYTEFTKRQKKTYSSVRDDKDDDDGMESIEADVKKNTLFNNRNFVFASVI